MGAQTENGAQKKVYTVEELVAVNPYNPDILPDLENYINDQQVEEQFKMLILLSHYLETGRFRQFWDEAAKNRSMLEIIPGFEKAVQAYAIHVLSLTYQKVPRTILAEAVNIEGPALDKFIEHHVANDGWTLETGRGRSLLVVFPQNEFNHPDMKRKSKDTVPLEHVVKVFPILG